MRSRPVSPSSQLSLALALALASALTQGSTPQAASLSDVEAIPHLDARGRDGYRQFLATLPPRAFAIAPGGAWGYSTAATSPELAEAEALAHCQAHTTQRCQLYARDETLVFDRTAWAAAWGPYLGAVEASQAPTGVRLGERFPDLALDSPKGQALRLSDLRGQVLVLHFWGSWCAPCQGEMSELAATATQLAGDPDIAFVPIPAREAPASARAWMAERGLALPLYDAGVRSDRDESFTLADGQTRADREFAPVFPTTYVLDKRGIVLFVHRGPLADWPGYLPLLRHAASHSGA